MDSGVRAAGDAPLSPQEPLPPEPIVPTPSMDGAGPPASRWRRTLVIEVWIVFAISLAAGGVSALLDLINSLTVHKALSTQHAVLNGSVTPDSTGVDLPSQ